MPQKAIEMPKSIFQYFQKFEQIWDNNLHAQLVYQQMNPISEISNLYKNQKFIYEKNTRKWTRSPQK